MKSVVLAIFVLLGTMPVQASFCAMAESPDAAHAQHGGMPMDDASGTDCCEEDATLENCGVDMNCGASVAGVDAVDSAPGISLMISHPGLSAPDGSPPVFEPHTPPFRPPIS